MNELEKIVREILDKGYLMSLGTSDEGGPWVSDVIFVNDGLSLFWISSMGARHSKAIDKNQKVSATITVSNSPGEKNLGLQIEGLAEKIKRDNFELVKKHWTKRKKAVPKKDEEVLDPDESWYKLTPTKFGIINEKLWGFKKKTFEL